MKPADNHIYEGDCIEVMRQWEDGCIDHCITDPPYNMSKKNGLGWAFSSHVTMSEQWDIFPRENYLEFTRLWLDEVCRLVKPNGNIFVFGRLVNRCLQLLREHPHRMARCFATVGKQRTVRQSHGAR